MRGQLISPTDVVRIYVVILKMFRSTNAVLKGTQNKKEYAYNQSYARKSEVLPDMGRTDKERGESHAWALMFMLPV